MGIKIIRYSNKYADKTIYFYNNFFRNNKRSDLINADDILNINDYYFKTDGTFLLLIDENKIVGGIGLGIHHKVWMIRRFFLDKKYQHQGFGTKMLKKAINFAIEKEIDRIYLGCMFNYKIANAMYEKNGFQKCDNTIGSSADFVMCKEMIPLRIIGGIKKIKTTDSKQLILNPVENYPFQCPYSTLFMEDYYVSSKIKKDKNDIIIFSGRESYTKIMCDIKKIWCNALGANFIDIKPLSGLNAHIALFLSLKSFLPNNRCLILSVKAGGHYLSKEIIESLGFEVLETPIKKDSICVDKTKTMQLINTVRPAVIIIDRSEGLYYEDFSYLKKVDSIKIFDASQYLADIICDNRYTNPFDMGFDIIISTTHKNYPGYQKALIFFRDSSLFNLYMTNSKKYYSSINVRSLFNTTFPIINISELKKYQTSLCRYEELFISELKKNGLPVFVKNTGVVQHHIWISNGDQDNMYEYFKDLEKANILVNYRLLPYDIGYGLRIGIQNLVRKNIDEAGIKTIAKWFGDIYKNRNYVEIKKDVERFSKLLKVKN